MQRGIRRGDLYWVDLSPVVGSEQGGVRLCLVIQNDTGNHFSTTVIVACVTSSVKKKMPTHVELNAETYNLDRTSFVLLEQIRTVDKLRLADYVGSLDNAKMDEVNRVLMLSCGLAAPEPKRHLQARFA